MNSGGETSRDISNRGRTAECGGASRAGTDAAELVVAVDASGVTVVEGELDGVVPHRGGRARFYLWFEHGQCSGGLWSGTGEILFLFAFVLAGRAGAFVTKVGELVMARVAVGPGNIDTRTGAHVNFHGSGLSARIDGHRHRNSLPCGSQHS
jgi:hypothetical protein